MKVTVNDARAVVTSHNSQPSLHLRPGDYTIRGNIRWAARPESLTIPTVTGLLQLTVDDAIIDTPDRSPQSVWLGEPRRDAGQPES